VHRNAVTDIASPPATGVWYDLDATVAAVLAILRLQGGDVDTTRIRAIIPGAALRIDVYVDRAVIIDGPPPGADYQYALEQLTVQRYRRDAPVAVMGTFPVIDDETHLLDTIIAGRRERWGVS
jgi:hypothetical protein